MHCNRNGWACAVIWILLLIVLFAPYGCVSQQTARQGPPVDRDLERTNRAARTAFDNGRIRQAADLYRQALERAYLRDDLAAATDARFNLAVCLTLLQSDQEALELVIQAREELSRAGQPVPNDIHLLEATILYRQGKLEKAWQITDNILQTPEGISSPVRSKIHFLRGLIASDRYDWIKLKLEIDALGKPNSPGLRADQQELIGNLSMAERNWDEAVLAFDEAAALRRQILDYRGMVKALAKAGEACERDGRLVPAARRFLRAGQSAARQGDSHQARIWLDRAAKLAEQGGDGELAQEARFQLAELQEDRAVSPSEGAPGIEGRR
ncbi:MAG: tetratricopeptide repeat protein [Desulfobacterales bacterium]|nr:MAG: tetratricopeptide repeat protein [Desulfobacterales bacterium]